MWNKGLRETSSQSALGIGTGCLGQSPSDLLQTSFRANPGYGPCKRLPLLLTPLSVIHIFQHVIWSKLSNGNVLKTSGERMKMSPATVCLLPIRYIRARSIQVYQVGWERVGGTWNLYHACQISNESKNKRHWGFQGKTFAAEEIKVIKCNRTQFQGQVFSETPYPKSRM